MARNKNRGELARLCACGLGAPTASPHCCSMLSNGAVGIVQQCHEVLAWSGSCRGLGTEGLRTHAARRPGAQRHTTSSASLYGWSTATAATRFHGSIPVCIHNKYHCFSESVLFVCPQTELQCFLLFQRLGRFDWFFAGFQPLNRRS